MQRIKITRITGIQTALIAAMAAFFFLTAYAGQVSLGQKFQRVLIDEEEAGTIAADADVEGLLLQARRELAAEESGRLCLTYDWRSAIENTAFTPLMTERELIDAAKQIFRKKQSDSRVPVYTVAVEDYRASFSSLEEVTEFLEKVKQPSDTADAYGVSYEKEKMETGAILVAALAEREQKEEAPETDSKEPFAGVAAWQGQALNAKSGRDAYQTGLLDMDFVEKVSVYRTYREPEQVSDMEEALAEVTKQKESNKIYVVESGDCLSVIALDYGTTVAELMALNQMESADRLREGEKLIIAVPEPDLQLRLVMGEVYEEDYEKTPVIVKNDSWYTTKEVVLQEGSTGHRERNDVVVYENGIEVKRNLVQQTVLVESAAAVIERGTIKPPTYIKPLYGGRYSSGFGYRWGRLHKGVDFACPVGTKVYASSAGTVLSVGYNKGGYGNNVVISHPDGRLTRYAHNSKILVHVGQHVEQGETIALSGNTGRSTGPHLHFEIYINGAPVNPLKYIQ